MPDFLAFSLITILALRWGVGKLRIPTIMGTVAEDAVWYFLVIFTSHFVLEMTLLLGRVSATVPPLSVLPLMIPNTCVCRNLSNYFQLGKSITDPNCNPPSRSVFRHHDQRECRVSPPRMVLCSLTTKDRLMPVSGTFL